MSQFNMLHFYDFLSLHIDSHRERARRVIHVDAENELEATAVSHCVDAKALFAQFDASRRAQARVCLCDHGQRTSQRNHSTKIAQKWRFF
jgi:hypothetical protein